MVKKCYNNTMSATQRRGRGRPKKQPIKGDNMEVSTEKKLTKAEKEALAKKVVEKDVEEVITSAIEKDYRKKYNTALKAIATLQKDNEAILHMTKQYSFVEIKKPKKNVSDMCTAFAVLSDWHFEEEIKKSFTNGLNEMNLQIAHERVNNLFYNIVKILKQEMEHNTVKTLILAFNGDLISGSAHEDIAEMALLKPMDASFAVQTCIISGIKYIRQELPDLVIKCIGKGGNHSRTTKEIRKATFAGYSLEQYMYYNLKLYFENDKHIEWTIEDSYYTYFTVYNKTWRISHGHEIRENQGTYGIMVPVLKTHLRVNATRKADYEIFAHFHQLGLYSNIVINGALCGYGSLSAARGYKYEPPSQAFFMFNSDGVIFNFKPIFLEGKK